MKLRSETTFEESGVNLFSSNVWRRVLGDRLSIKFCPEGTLSTALLYVDGSRVDVASQLPGLHVSNADSYLRVFGWRRKVEAQLWGVAKLVHPHLSSLGLYVDDVCENASTYRVVIAYTRDRLKACPSAQIVGEFDFERGEFLTVRSLRSEVSKDILVHVDFLSSLVL